jgi:hypothetical protein
MIKQKPRGFPRGFCLIDYRQSGGWWATAICSVLKKKSTLFHSRLRRARVSPLKTSGGILDRDTKLMTRRRMCGDNQ